MDVQDVVLWLGGAGGLAQVSQVAVGAWDRWGRDFLDRFQQESGLSDEEIAIAAKTREDLVSIMITGLDAAMRSAAQDKRWLLARVVASAFRHDDARLDEFSLFLRTASALEPADIRVLTAIADTRPNSFANVGIVGTIRTDELRGVLDDDQRSFLAPIVSTLIREGLVVDEAIGTLDYQPAWLLTPYGFRFLRFLPGSVPDELAKATVVGVHAQTYMTLKNLGPSDALVTAVTITSDGESLVPELPLPVDLEPGERFTWPASPLTESGAIARIDLTWIDRAGTEHRSTRAQSNAR